MKKIICLILVLIISSCASSENNSESDIKIKEFVKTQAKYNGGQIKYPYTADEARKNQIINNLDKLKGTITPNEVIEILSHPDEIREYREIKGSHSEIKGFLFFYIIQRLKVSGSDSERKELLVKLHFNLDFKLKRMDISVSGSDNSASKQDLVKKMKEFEKRSEKKQEKKAGEKIDGVKI